MIRRFLKRLWKGKRGNIAMVCALVAVPITIAVGMGVDYTNSAQRKDQLDGIADAAALAAVAPTELSQSSTDAGTVATNVFNSQLAAANVTNVSPSVTVTDTATSGTPGTPGATGKTRTAVVTYTAQVTTFFPLLVGFQAITIGGKSTAIKQSPYYTNMYIIVDTSQSMGIASTAADMNRLYALTNASAASGYEGCVFGCHVVDEHYPAQTVSNEYVAHNATPAITLRIDSAVTAIQTILNSAVGTQNASQYLKIGLYTMSGYPSPLVTAISPPSSNYVQLQAAASGIDLGPNDPHGVGDTDLASQFAQFQQLIPANGDGLTAGTPLNYVYIVTDGTTDVPGACTDGHCTAPFNPALCTPLKAKAKVGVIYTTYLPIYLNNNPTLGLDARYQALVYPFATQIAPNLQACASSAATYYEATDGPTITKDMNALFEAAINTAHLTQ